MMNSNFERDKKLTVINELQAKIRINKKATEMNVNKNELISEICAAFAGVKLVGFGKHKDLMITPM